MTWWTTVSGLTPIAVHDARNISGTLFLDRVGSNNISFGGANITNGADTDVFSVPGNSGALVYVSPANIPTNCTICALVFEVDGTYTFYNAAANGYIRHDNSGDWVVRATSEDSPYTLGTSPFENKFTFLTLVKNGTSAVMYVDGVQVGTAASSHLPPSIHWIGYPGGHGFKPTESISALGFWSGAATEAEVIALEAACRAAMARALNGATATAQAATLSASGTNDTAMVYGITATSSAGVLLAEGISESPAILSGASAASSAGIGAIYAAGTSEITGATITAASGSISATGTDVVFLPGASTTSGAGAVSSGGTATITLPSASSTFSAGAVLATVSSVVELVGATTTSDTGAISAAGAATGSVTGQEVYTSCGSISAAGSASALVPGSGATAAPGSLTAAGSCVATIVGGSTSLTAGSVAAGGSGVADVVGAATSSYAAALTLSSQGLAALPGAGSTSTAGALSAEAGALTPIVGANIASSAGLLTASGFARAVLTGTFANANATGALGRFNTPLHRTARIAPDVPRIIRVPSDPLRVLHVARENRTYTVPAEARVHVAKR